MTIRNEIPSLPVRVQTLGTGGPRPDPERAGPATVVKIGDETLLFDVGRGVVVQMVRAGIALESLKDVFITHHHFDHIGDLFDVALSTWLHGRRHALSFRGPPDTKRIMNALLTQVYDKDIEWRSDGEPTHGGWSAIDTVDVAPGLVAETERWRVFAESVVHGHGLEFSRAFLKRWICYGYRVETQGKVVAISGDTVDCAGLRRLAKNADVLVQCCYLADAEITNEHFRNLAKHTLACGDTVGKIAAACNVGTLVLTHHRPRNETAMIERLREEVSRDFHGRLIIANDLEEITL
ncbi:ribonuclease Z [Achromobacter denitrificans]|nr:MBL fold metallo-hydrolase [Achromobacter denitrificans]GFN26587.1 metal-dependent hydrolase [Achromobacter denitrificans]CAB3652502.1 Ribonuclease BN [Achromobacter denitrificans]SUU13092.1 ribonuclease Z [Achromobacter denitrificans]